MSNVLVTGGAGLIGSALCRRLLDQDNNVVAIDNLITSDGTNIKQFSRNKNFVFIKHDITKPFGKSLNSHLSFLNSIFHLACPTGVPNLIRLASEMLATCSIGTLNVLKLARKNNAKVIFTSSSEIYGDPIEFPQIETYTGNVNPTGVRSPYEEGKRFSESLIASYVRKYNLDARIIRVFNTYGPGSAPSETRVIPHFLYAALHDLPLLVTGSGQQTRTFCYVDDLVDALLTVSKSGKQGEVYNAGGDTEISILQTAKIVLKVTNSRSEIQFIDQPKHDHHGRLPDLTKIKSLGWNQKISIYEGLKKTIHELV